MFQGENIKEVWDYRLSTAVPQIIRSGGTWLVEIYSKSNPDYNPKDPSTLAKPLETHDTGIASEKGDTYNLDKIKVCFEWLLTVRDKYSLPNIEELKPLVKTINEANQKLAELGGA